MAQENCSTKCEVEPIGNACDLFEVGTCPNLDQDTDGPQTDFSLFPSSPPTKYPDSI